MPHGVQDMCFGCMGQAHSRDTQASSRTNLETKALGFTWYEHTMEDAIGRENKQ